MNKKTKEKGRIDWLITLVPFILIMGVATLLFILPEQSNDVISKVRFFFGDTLGSYYLIIGVGFLLVALFLAFSKYGNIVLGKKCLKKTAGCMINVAVVRHYVVVITSCNAFFFFSFVKIELIIIFFPYA